jgi:hypothetical protein
VGLADDRKPVNLMTVHVSKSVTAHEVSNSKLGHLELRNINIGIFKKYTYRSK